MQQFMIMFLRKNTITNLSSCCFMNTVHRLQSQSNKNLTGIESQYTASTFDFHYFIVFTSLFFLSMFKKTVHYIRRNQIQYSLFLSTFAGLVLVFLSSILMGQLLSTQALLICAYTLLKCLKKELIFLPIICIDAPAQLLNLLAPSQF